jgi:hypothetical protein
MDVDPERTAAGYRRYVNDGPYVPWGKSFGRRCPPPDFSGARWRPVRKEAARVRRFVAANMTPASAAGSAALVPLALVLFWWRRGRRVRGAV